MISKSTKKSVSFFLESRWREWVLFFFFLFSAFCYILYCILSLVYWENQCLSLSLSTFQVINMVFLMKCGTKVWCRGYLDVVIFFLRMLKIWWCVGLNVILAFLPCEKWLEIICFSQFSIKGLNNLGGVLHLLGEPYFFCFFFFFSFFFFFLFRWERNII